MTKKIIRLAISIAVLAVAAKIFKDAAAQAKFERLRTAAGHP